ncbi:MAG: VWA domain-containing protein [Ardenticatenaceae bacterium]|nr:VWA domain-containing protein [Ardenticatenaceae bacterium]
MTFIWPIMLLPLLLLPLLVWYYLRQVKLRDRGTAVLGPLGIVRGGDGTAVGRRRHWPPALFAVGLTLLLFSLSRPELPVSLPRIEGTVILAFDVSSSMLAEDLEPSRIEAAKEAARVFVENQPSTIRVGVVAFSNGGLVVQPPTDVQADVLATIDRLTPQGGTSLGQGIFTALNAIAGQAIVLDEAALEEGDLAQSVEALQIDDFSSAVIVLLSDGENTEFPEPLDIAQIAAEAGVRVYTVGIGSPQGALLELDGFSVMTQLNEATLQEIASLTNGSYYFATDEEELRDIYQNIDLQLTIRGESMEVTSILAGISLVFMLVSGALSLLWFGRVP